MSEEPSQLSPSPSTVAQTEPRTTERFLRSPSTATTFERPGRSFSCYIAPIVGTQQEYEEFFKSEGFGHYTDLHIRSRDGFIRFATQSDAELFLDHFLNITFKGQKMRVEKTRSTPSGGKALHLSGFTPGLLTERAIYERMLEFGFIRRVALKRDFAFVDFDTVEEAASVVRERRFIEISGETVRVVFARSEPKMETKLTIPLKELVPLSHPFWYQLQDLMYEAG
jgi:hypothetical protein